MRCLLSIFSFLPSSRHTMKSGFTEERIETLGSSFGSGAAEVRVIPLSAAWTFWMRFGRSFTATLLLLTCAATMSAVRVSNVSSATSTSAIAIILNYVSRGLVRTVRTRLGPSDEYRRAQVLRKNWISRVYLTKVHGRA